MRAVDPACGSGAYLLGLLQKLFELGYLLRWRRAAEDAGEPNLLYRKKLELLQRCVFGVDRDATAVRIARLRLWLSLTVENKAGERPEPLPHLDFRIEEGDSLAVPIRPTVLDAGLLREYAKAKREFGTRRGADREALRAEIERLKGRIRAAYGVDLPTERPAQPALAAAWDLKQAKIAKARPLAALAARPFDWAVEFAEVFADEESPVAMDGRLNLGPEAGRRGQGTFAEAPARPGGFDIVLANPPYVAMGLLRDIKPGLKSQYAEVHSDRSDLFVYFFQRAVEVLRPGGQLAFVTSDKWLTANYGRTLRAFMARRCPPRVLLDYADNQVFAGVNAYPLITLAGKECEVESVLFATLPPLKELDTRRRRSWRSTGACYPLRRSARMEIWGYQTSSATEETVGGPW